MAYSQIDACGDAKIRKMGSQTMFDAKTELLHDFNELYNRDRTLVGEPGFSKLAFVFAEYDELSVLLIKQLLSMHFPDHLLIQRNE